jgi:hypothetical protein
MDGGNDGYYQLVHDGTGEPGTLEYAVTAAAHGVVVGRVYRFKVSALNFNGEGAASSESLIHACLSPANFSAPRYVTSDETTLSIEWAAPNITNGCPIDKYQLFRDTGSTDAITTQVGGDLEPHVTSATITLAGADTSKTFRVQLAAFNDAGSVLSGIGEFILANVPEAPSAPVNDASVTNNAQIKVRFAETLPNARGSSIFAVQLAMDDGLGGELTTVVGADEEQMTMVTTYLAESVVEGRYYTFRCRVKNSIGWSAWSTDTLIVAAVTPGKPDPPLLVAATATTIELQFFVPATSGGTPLTSYELFRNDGNDANEATIQVTTYTSNSLTHTLTTAADSVVTGTIYRFRFRAVNAIGNSEYSDTVRYAVVDPPAAPALPTVMQAQTSTSQIAFEWAKVVPVAGQETGQTIHGYLAYMMEVNKAASSVSQTEGEYTLVYNGTINPDTAEVVVKNLDGEAVRAGYEYKVKVVATYLNGETAESAVASIMACSSLALADGVDWAPLLVSTSSTQMTLSWPDVPAATPPVDGCHITGYQLYMSGDDGATYSEIDSALVRDKPNLHQHTVATSNFAAASADVGETFLFKLDALNVASTVTSSSLAVVLADAPPAPASAPALDPA